MTVIVAGSSVGLAPLRKPRAGHSEVRRRVKRTAIRDDPTIVLFGSRLDTPTVNRVAEVGPYLPLPRIDENRDIDALLVTVPSLDRYERTLQSVRAAFEESNRPAPLLLLGINVCTASTVSEAMHRFDTALAQFGPTLREKYWFVGTETGLASLIKDLELLKLGDGVMTIPLPMQLS